MSGETCQNCRQRDATEIWAESALEYSRGSYARWCKVCCLRRQLTVARQRAADIPRMERELAELTHDGTGDAPDRDPLSGIERSNPDTSQKAQS